jgi:hypothetical protein
MNTFPRVYKIQCTETALIVELTDGRTITTLLIWFPRLANSSKQQLENWELRGDGEGIH